MRGGVEAFVRPLRSSLSLMENSCCAFLIVARLRDQFAASAIVAVN